MKEKKKRNIKLTNQSILQMTNKQNDSNLQCQSLEQIKQPMMLINILKPLFKKKPLLSSPKKTQQTIFFLMGFDIPI